MVVGAISPEQLAPLQAVFPNSVYWQLRQGQGDILAAQASSGEVQAILAAERRAGSVELLWLWVAPSLRRQGLGTLLLARLLGSAIGQGVTSLQAEIPFSAEYLQMWAFLNRIPGKYFAAEGHILVTTLGAVNLERIGGPAARTTGISLEQAEPWQKYLAVQKLKEQRMPYGTTLLERCYDQRLSRLFFRDGALCAMLLCEAGEHLCLSYLWCENGWSHILPGLLQTSLRQACAAYPPETELYTAAVIPAAQRLGKALLPEAREIPVLRYRCMIG